MGKELPASIKRGAFIPTSPPQLCNSSNHSLLSRIPRSCLTRGPRPNQPQRRFWSSPSSQEVEASSSSNHRKRRSILPVVQEGISSQRHPILR